MRLIYNGILLFALIVFAPLLFVKIILTPRYRGRILRRLGIGLPRELTKKPGAHPRLWIHALSVGEVSSSRPLVRGLRARFPGAAIFFSSATQSGETYAREVLAAQVDAFVPFPLDAPFCVKGVMEAVRPDLFILVETDFWPNFLWALQRRRVAAVLVNGRISESSFGRYRKLSWFFLPLFASFRVITMQTAADARNLIKLGVAEEKIKVLGNLKYEAATPEVHPIDPEAGREKYLIPADALLWVAGSTHPGEEEIVLDVFRALRRDFPRLFLVIAPRNIQRVPEILKIAAGGETGEVSLRSASVSQPRSNLMILDTFGELAGLYGICDVAFLGGSLVPEGGHNPLEPAAFGKPVIFGPHMDDFGEISRGLLLAGGALMVHSKGDLQERLRELLNDAALRRQIGDKGKKLIAEQQGVTSRHLEVIRQILDKGEAA